MKIELHRVSIRELTHEYRDRGDDGVIGFGGLLDIRPPYQREFIYEPRERDAVIDTVTKGYPLNVMYWAVRADGTYEVIDGQQRTISLAQYVNGEFSFNRKYFHSLQPDEQSHILDYELMVYHCSGTDSEKLKWFETINISGKELTPQELRNAVYHGSWVSDAKRYFSKKNCPADGIGGKYLKGDWRRQEHLETAIKWISDGNIESYMSDHHHDSNAEALWIYFRNVIDWVKLLFPKYRREMQGIEWGRLYNLYRSNTYNPEELETEVARLMMDEDVSRKKGIYEFLITGRESYLNLRKFDDRIKREVYERQKGVCPVCEETFTFEEMEADHIVPWRKGGLTTIENCQMLCELHNRLKGGA